MFDKVLNTPVHSGILSLSIQKNWQHLPFSAGLPFTENLISWKKFSHELKLDNKTAESRNLTILNYRHDPQKKYVNVNSNLQVNSFCDIEFWLQMQVNY